MALSINKDDTRSSSEDDSEDLMRYYIQSSPNHSEIAHFVQLAAPQHKMLPGQRASLAKQGLLMARGLTRIGEVASISTEGGGQSRELGWGWRRTGRT